MRKIHILFIVIAAVSVLPSCSNVVTRRTVEIEIPSHPWEKASGSRLWYTLKWTDGTDIRGANAHAHAAVRTGGFIHLNAQKRHF